MPLSSLLLTIVVGARTSPLSRVQVDEVFNELRAFHPYVEFIPKFVTTVGDRDQTSSLRNLEKTDFFTVELDRMVIEEECQVAIHSAKDLPDPLPRGLALIALTKGVDPSDAFVMRDGESFDHLTPGARIATSSKRREESVCQLRGDLTFIDLRGTINQRLDKLYTGDADGVIVAEAALIRLGLDHLNRILLPGKSVEGQGKLAVIARIDDEEMRLLFTSIDTQEL